jgi:16S rRNA (uracil1498-N3)-methyltransferase
LAHFYLASALDGASPGSLVRLEGSEARHAATVSRLRVGEPVVLGDGGGTVVRGTVESAGPALLEVRVGEVERVERPERELVLVQALAKGDRDELAVQAATELGVDRIIPWQAERSISRWSGPKAERGRERWEVIAREAVKQSIRPWLPEVEPLADAGRLAGLLSTHAVLVLEPTGTLSFADAAAQAGDRPLAVVVGPEGGISDRELAAFAAGDALLTRLGPSILRTSTAGPAALAALAVLTGRWQ